MGWLLCKKHPLVREKGATLDMSDLTSEPVLAFQRKLEYFLYKTFRKTNKFKN